MLLKIAEFNIENQLNIEGQTTIGNGKINIRGSFEEGLASVNQNQQYMRFPANVTIEAKKEQYSKFGIFNPSITGNHPLLNNVIVNLPYFIGIKIYADGSKFDMETSDYQNLNIQLDTLTGVLTRELIWQPSTNSQVQIKWERFASSLQDQNIAQQLTIKIITGNPKLVVEHSIDSLVTTSGYNHFATIDLGFENNTLLCQGETDASCQFWIKSVLESNGHNRKLDISRETVKIIEEVNGSYLATRISNVNTTDFNLVNIDYQQLKAEHIKNYYAEMNQSRILITGDEHARKLQNLSDFSIYHLLRAQNKYSDEYAICAKGFAGEAYFGHYFWDTEIYMLPFYTLTNPARARKLLMYRVNCLENAKKNANRYGYQGAKFPWESSLDGSEQCANWQYADFEIHVSADIVYALDKYCQITNDFTILSDGGLELIKQVALYFKQRIYEKNGQYSLNGVMGPDEYMFFVNNNYFTNYMVNNVFKIYKKYVELLQCEEIDLQILNLIDKLPLIKKGNVLIQCENFELYEEIDQNRIWPERTGYFASNISQEQNYRSKFLKQADVVNLFHLYNQCFTPAEVAASIEYYEPITSHDSSLSEIMHAIVRASLDQVSVNEIISSGGIDLFDCGCGEGIHIANAGGVWQAIVYGLCGLSQNTDQLQFNSRRLAPGIEQITFNLMYKGCLYTIVKMDEEVRIKPVHKCDGI